MKPKILLVADINPSKTSVDILQAGYPNRVIAHVYGKTNSDTSLSAKEIALQMAAGPDLLDVCEQMINWMGDAKDESPAFKSWYRSLKNAVSKARGE